MASKYKSIQLEQQRVGATDVKSPFLVIDGFLSDLRVDNLLNDLDADSYEDGMDRHGNPTILRVPINENIVQSLGKRVMELYPTLEKYYDVKIKGIRPFDLTIVPEKVKEAPSVAGYQFAKKWIKVSKGDLIASLVLVDTVTGEGFDPTRECLGGEFEFTSFNLTMSNTRGTLIVHPNTPHFMRATSQVRLGRMYRIDMVIVCEEDFVYQPEKFKGHYLDWFNNA